MSQAGEIPLLCRPRVLFPGGVINLHLSEPRQLEQLKVATEGGFGYCLLSAAGEQRPTHHMRVGTVAVIEDCNRDAAGRLQLRLRGGRRFRITTSRCLHDGRLLVRPCWFGEPTVQLPVDFAPLGQIVARYMEKAQSEYPLHRPVACEDASYVGFRLAEMLPMELVEKQMLLELDDPLLRLNMLTTILPRFQPE